MSKNINVYNEMNENYKLERKSITGYASIDSLA